MIDEIAIQQTINLYCEGVSKFDWDQVVATFAEDGVWEVPTRSMRFEGHAAIRAALGAVEGTIDYVVMMNAPAIIAVEGSTARARSLIREFSKAVGKDEGFEAFGSYEDRLVKTADGWKFAHRAFRLKAKHNYALLPGAVVR